MVGSKPAFQSFAPGPESQNRQVVLRDVLGGFVYALEDLARSGSVVSHSPESTHCCTAASQPLREKMKVIAGSSASWFSSG